MTEAANSALPSQAAPQPAPFLHTWVESLSQVLAQISGSPLPCAILTEAPAEMPPPNASDLWIVGTCSGGLRGEMSLRLTAASILRLAQIFMSEPPAPEVEVTSDHREATVELLRQVGGFAATALKATWGEVQLRLDPATGAPSWPASSTSWLRTGEDPLSAGLVEMHLSAALVAALRSDKTESPKSLAPSPIAPPPITPPDPAQNQIRLDLLMDVQLAVTLRFGSRRLLLREVLDLIPGAVVDLDRQIEDPIDVLLDGRLVARGEVVVLNGNYGVRVTEIAPPNS
jgi:flagellar motor switch protein FliN/FliY